MRPVCSSTMSTSPFDDDVVLVALEQLLGLDRVVEVADQRGVDGLVEVVDAEVVLDLLDAGLEDADGALLLVDLVVAVAASQRALRRAWRTRRTTWSAWSAGPEMISGVRASSMRIESTSSTMAKLWPRWTSSSGGPGHVVAQVVEAELVVRAVGDVRGVLRRAAASGVIAGEDAAGRPARGTRCTRPISSDWYVGQVVVDRDDVHALAGRAR